MDNHLIKNLKIPASDCDHTSRLSAPDTFALFQDAATDHRKCERAKRHDFLESVG